MARHVHGCRGTGRPRPFRLYGGVDRKRFIIETNGSGVALVDVDNDGWLDALVLSGTRLKDGGREDAALRAADAPTNRLYRNTRNGRFEDVTDRAGLRRTGWASSVCAGDYDNDGWTDLFVTYFGRNVLYRNLGSGRFEDVTRAGFSWTRALGLRLHVPRLRSRRPSRPVRCQLPAVRSQPLPSRGAARTARGRGFP